MPLILNPCPTVRRQDPTIYHDNGLDLNGPSHARLDTSGQAIREGRWITSTQTIPGHYDEQPSMIPAPFTRASISLMAIRIKTMMIRDSSPTGLTQQFAHGFEQFSLHFPQCQLESHAAGECGHRHGAQWEHRSGNPVLSRRSGCGALASTSSLTYRGHDFRRRVDQSKARGWILSSERGRWRGLDSRFRRLRTIDHSVL